MKGWSEKVTDSLRRPSFHSPYSTESAMNITMSSWMAPWPANSSTPATPTIRRLVPETRNTAYPVTHITVASRWIRARRRTLDTSGNSARAAIWDPPRMAAKIG